MVRYTLEQHVFLYDTYVKCGSATKCQWKFWCKFRDERVSHRQTIHKVNKLRKTGLLIAKKQKHKHLVLTEEKLDDTGTRLEHTPRKSLKCLAQVTGESKSSARMATQLVKLTPYKTIVIHALQPHNPDSRVHFCSWFLQSVVKGQIDPQLTFSSDAACFHLQGYTNMQNNCYWCPQNPHITHEIPLRRVKAGVCCASSARRIVGSVFFNETINCKTYLTYRPIAR
jgi:hypothetical protein